MESVKRIINGVDKTYLLRSYVFSAVITFLALSGGDGDFMMALYAIISGILFPFSALVWDSVMSLLIGDNIIFLPLPMMLIWKFFKICMLYVFAIIIAPFGILYIHLRNR